MNERREIILDLESLDAIGQLAWIQLTTFASRELSWQGEIVISPDQLHGSVVAALGRADVSRQFLSIRFSRSELEPTSDSEFVFLADSARFSRKLLTRFSRFYIAPGSRPHQIDAGLFWMLQSEKGSLEELGRALNRSGELGSQFEAYRTSLKPVSPEVTLITSVFNGDKYIRPFLENMTKLKMYDRYQHMLIRPGSSGEEHEKLCAHVRQYRSAVYINLLKDPGLYEVWNLAARLADAPYLSNANLDDCRAPTHVAELTAQLERNCDADVASAALRITEVPNLGWNQAANMPVWYGKEVGTSYTAASLLKSKSGVRPSHNIPHCMPIWRRSLHALHGYFRESAYGPSSDWEFWLRVGVAGAKFVHVPKPLGLYLRNKDSYWRRDSRGGECDRRIAMFYRAVVGNEEPGATEADEWPVTFSLREIRELGRTGAHVELVSRLLKTALRVSRNEDIEESRVAVDDLGVRYLGIRALCDVVDESPLRRIAEARNSVDILELIIDILHEWPEAERKRLAEQRPGRVLFNALIDLQSVTRDVRALIAIAMLARYSEHPDAERQYLFSAHALDSRTFWYGVQQLYRFQIPLSEMTELVDSRIRVSPPESAIGGSDVNLWFYPDYSKGNPYQRLLYAELRKSGNTVNGAEGYSDIRDLEPVKGKRNIFHLHWVHPVLQPAEGVFSAQHAAQFLSGIRSLQRRGFEVYWTIHNALGHEARFRDLEREFRARLARLVDRVYVHHPVVPSLLDWLPESTRLHLVEHGSYSIGQDIVRKGKVTRESLGFTKNDVVLIAFGQFREYKNFDCYLPALARAMRRSPKLKLLVAGRIASRTVRRELEKLPPEQLVVKDEFIPDDELSKLLCASDFAFLSYRAILTSGSLFHAFSAGLPVIAPVLGTIPAYVVNGWNGYLYNDVEELDGLLGRDVCNGSERETLSSHALETARSLHWALQ